MISNRVWNEIQKVYVLSSYVIVYLIKVIVFEISSIEKHHMRRTPKTMHDVINDQKM